MFLLPPPVSVDFAVVVVIEFFGYWYPLVKFSDVDFSIVSLVLVVLGWHKNNPFLQ